MYPCSRMLCSNQQGYSDITSSTCLNSKICWILPASVACVLFLVEPDKPPCLLLLPGLRGFTLCVSSLETGLSGVSGSRGVGEVVPEARCGRNCEDDIWSVERPCGLTCSLPNLLSLGSDRRSLCSDNFLRCLLCIVLSSCDLSGESWKSFAELKRLKRAALSRL